MNSSSASTVARVSPRLTSGLTVSELPCPATAGARLVTARQSGGTVDLKPLSATTPHGQGAIQPGILYGFERNRDIYEYKHPSSDGAPMFRVNDLNYCLGLGPGVERNYAYMLRTLKVAEGADPLLAEALKNGPGDLHEDTRVHQSTGVDYITSWRHFLGKHASKLGAASLLKLHKLEGQNAAVVDKRLHSFINKNLIIGITASEGAGIKSLLEQAIQAEEPDVALTAMMESCDELRGIVRTAFFRKTSKLGLDWAHERGIPVSFVEAQQARDALVALREQQPATGESPWPYQVPEHKFSYLPITFSEMKHIQRMGYSITDALV